jgi:hypothetical protein
MDTLLLQRMRDIKEAGNHERNDEKEEEEPKY